MEEISKQQREFLNQFETIKDSLWRFCLSITGNRFAAEDVLSQTILESFSGFAKLKNTGAFKSWIFTIAKRISIRNYNESGRFIPITDEVCQMLAAEVDEPHKEEIAELYRAIASLPAPQKEAILLFEINGLSRTEVAEIQNTNVETVKKRLAAGRKKLKEKLISVSKIGMMA